MGTFLDGVLTCGGEQDLDGSSSEIPDELTGPERGHTLEPALIKTGGGQVEVGYVIWTLK